ncbi:MAG: hypothetical protein QN198_01125 [Armatimonadota bacterium]|nr:hypothetical protein [Armatimonadota bacterium]MDR5702185.1 hypothetical protein [Armatimonadota bacterium]
MRLPRNRLEEWRRQLAKDFHKPVSMVKVVRQGGSEYLHLKVTPAEIERYLSTRYPTLSQATPPLKRGRHHLRVVPAETLDVEEVPLESENVPEEVEVETEEEEVDLGEEPGGPLRYRMRRAA